MTSSYDKPSPQRDAMIVALHKSGLSDEDIGAEFFLSAQVVHKTITRILGPDPVWAERAAAGLAKRREEHARLCERAAIKDAIRAAQLGRPIDMGGQRYRWLEFTPQSQFYEDQQMQEAS